MRRKYYPSLDSLAPLSVAGPRSGPAGGEARLLCPTPSRARAAQSSMSRPPAGYVTIYRKHWTGAGAHSRSSPEDGTPTWESFHPFDSRMDALPAGLPALRRALRRPGRADGLGPRARNVVGPLPVRRARLDPLPALDAGRPEHRAQRPVGERRVGPLSRPSSRGHPRATDPRPLPGPRSQSQPRRAPARLRLRSNGRWFGGAINLFLLDLARRPANSRRATGWTRRRHGLRTAGSTSPRSATGCSTSSPWIPWDQAAGDLRLDWAPSTASRSRCGLLLGGFHDLSWNVYRIPPTLRPGRDRFSIDSTGAPLVAVGLAPPVIRRPAAIAGEPYRRKLNLDFAAGEEASHSRFGRGARPSPSS